MFKLSTQLSHHCHIFRRTVPSATRIFSSTYKAPQMTPRSISEEDSDRKIPSKDDINPTSKENTRSGTNDEVAHTDKAAYGKMTNPAQEKATAEAERKTGKPGNPLEYSPATPQISHQGENKSPNHGQKGRQKASGGSKNAT